MQGTIAQGFRPNMSEAETARLLQQMWQALNSVVSREKSATTAATGVATAIYTSDALAFGERAVIVAHVQGLSDDGTVYVYCGKAACFRRGTSGAAAQVGATQTIYQQTTGPAVTITVDASSQINLNVNDAAAATVKWRAWTDIRLSP